LDALSNGVFMTLRPFANSPVAKVTVSVSPIVRQSDGGREGGLLFNQLTCFSLGYTPAQRLSPPGSFEAGAVDDFMAAHGQGQTIDQYYFEIGPLSENALRLLFSQSRKKTPNNAQTASVVIKPESGQIDCGDRTGTPKKCTVIVKSRQAPFRQIIFSGDEAPQHQP
jgi:hypothetical protein